MSGRRVVIITRRFWPLVGEAESALAELAVGLRGAGWSPTILTARWRREWTQTLLYDDVPVVRLPPPARGRWGDWSYARRVGKWLRQAQPDFDVALALAQNQWLC